MSDQAQKRALAQVGKETKSKENVNQNITVEEKNPKKAKNMPDFARLHESLVKTQEKAKAAKKPPTVPHEFSLSSTNRKPLDLKQSNGVLSTVNTNTIPAQPTVHRHTITSLPSTAHLITQPAHSAERTSRTPGMTQLMPLKLPPIQPPPSAVTDSPSDHFTSFLPPPISFQPSAAPSSTGSHAIPWATHLVFSTAPQFIPPPSSSPARSQPQSSLSSTPSQTPVASSLIHSAGHHHAHNHHVSFADVTAIDGQASAVPPASPSVLRSATSASLQQSPSVASSFAGDHTAPADLTVDLEAGGITRERNPVQQSPAGSLPVSVTKTPQRPAINSTVLSHPIHQHTQQQQYNFGPATFYQPHASAIAAQQYHAHQEFRADASSYQQILHATHNANAASTEPPKRRETALGPPLRVPVKPRPVQEVKVDLHVESSPARTELARRMARDLSDSGLTPGRAAVVSRMTFTAGAYPITPSRSAATSMLPINYSSSTPRQYQMYGATVPQSPAAYHGAASSSSATPNSVQSINGITHLPPNGMVHLTPHTMSALNAASSAASRVQHYY